MLMLGSLPKGVPFSSVQANEQNAPDAAISRLVPAQATKVSVGTTRSGSSITDTSSK